MDPKEAKSGGVLFLIFLLGSSQLNTDISFSLLLINLDNRSNIRFVRNMYCKYGFHYLPTGLVDLNIEHLIYECRSLE